MKSLQCILDSGISTTFPIWDLSAALVTVEPSLVTSSEYFNLRVKQEVNEENDQSGKLIVTDIGKRSNVVMKINAEERLKSFLNVMKSSI